MEERTIRSELSGLPEFKVVPGNYRIKLDQNESPCRLPKKLLSSVLDQMRTKYGENRYPQPDEYLKKKKAVSDITGIPPENTIILNGADQGILLSMLISGPKIRLLNPTYPIYRNDALITGKKVSEAALTFGNGFGIPANAGGKDFDLVCLVSPNPPAGNLAPEDALPAALHDNRLVMMDEAYYDFSGITYTEYLKDHNNLIILRTMSKSCCLAGLRLGYAFAGRDIIDAMEKAVFSPYNISILHYALLDRFRDITLQAAENAKKINKVKAAFERSLDETGIKYFKSRGNFILMESSKEIFENLLRNGIKTRFYTIEGHEFIRITIGTMAEMSQAASVLRKAFR